MEIKNESTVLITGTAGFIGFHVAKTLLDRGMHVVGIDNFSDYYDVSLKESRENILKSYRNYRSIKDSIEAPDVLSNLFTETRPDVVIHLAAQAGVRYSIVNPRAYIESNIIGTFELLEAARANPPKHMLLASTSSAYGANEQIPYQERHKADHQVSFYAATKKSTENMAHSYSHLFGIPVTMLRFFTVYGPYGRPDMALYKFVKSIKEGVAIEVYNHGKMRRDFTYIDDVVDAIIKLIELPPELEPHSNPEFDSRSPVAPYRIVNVGNSKTVSLMEFISVIESALGKKAEYDFKPLQDGDVLDTWADTELLTNLIGPQLNTELRTGVKLYVEWFEQFYGANIKI